MQQEGVGGSQQQDRRLKLVPPENQQPLQPQKCPRCESLNTKFCYYNNYSLSQPRYFCKTCRRYWTQGGTLRNVPVGGGCRKGKRPKKPSPADDLQDQPPPPTRLQNQLDSVTTTSSTTLISTTSGPTLRKTETDLIMASSPMPPMVAAPSSFYYPSGGYLSSIAALQSFNPPMNVGGDFGGSNLALLQGFSLPTFNPQQQPQQFQQLLPAEENVIQARRPATTSYQEWNQEFVEATNSIKSEAGYWTSTSNNSNNTSGTSLNPNQWVGDLPGYVPPPLPPSSSSQSFL